MALKIADCAYRRPRVFTTSFYFLEMVVMVDVICTGLGI